MEALRTPVRATGAPPLGTAVMFRRSPGNHPEPGTVVGRCFGVPQIDKRTATTGEERDE